MKQLVRKMSIYSKVKPAPPIEVFQLNTACINDPFKDKVNLTVGAYKTEEGQPWVLPVIQKAKSLLENDKTINHEYNPAEGLPEFRKQALELLLGKDSAAIKEGRALPIQSLSGTGALRIGAEFLARVIGREVFYYSEPTWEAHSTVFLSAGFKTGKKYRYWDGKNFSLDIEGLTEDLCQAPKGAVIILHASAHNPTGTDPNKEQWERIADIIEERELFPFFDIAYQGFASGDPDQDSYSVRYFTEDRCMELLCAQSFSKNFGLYGERIGNLTMIQADSKTTQAVQSQMALLVRGLYTCPPSFGSRLVTIILSDPTLRKEWIDCINIMSSRIKKMRKALFENVTNLQTPGNWNHLVDQIGMFCFTGLSQQVKMLTDEFHIYLMGSGRINMCGINDKNVEYVAKAINAVVTKIKK